LIPLKFSGIKYRYSQGFLFDICRQCRAVTPNQPSMAAGGAGFLPFSPQSCVKRPNQRRDPADKRPSRQQIQSQNRAPISFSAGDGHNGGKK